MPTCLSGQPATLTFTFTAICPQLRSLSTESGTRLFFCSRPFSLHLELLGLIRGRNNRKRYNNWTIGDDQYRLANGFTRRSFSEGHPDVFDFWRTEGILTRNGTVVNTIEGSLVPDEAPTALGIVMEIEGEQVIIVSHLLQ